MSCQPYSTLSKARHVLIAEGLKPKKQWDWLRIRSDCTRQQRQNLRRPNTSSNDPPNTTHKGPSNAFADVSPELLLSNTVNHLWIFQVVIIFGITFAIEFAIIAVEAGLASRNIVLFKRGILRCIGSCFSTHCFLKDLPVRPVQVWSNVPCDQQENCPRMLAWNLLL